VGGFANSTGTTSEASLELLSTIGIELSPDTGRLLESGVDCGDVSSFTEDRLLNFEARLERLDLELSVRGTLKSSGGMELEIFESVEVVGKELLCSACTSSVLRVDFFLLLSVKGESV
jgi:hypothetical protein